MITPDEVRAFALSLPETVELETWGHPTFRVRDKIFATLSNDEPIGGVKATREEQGTLVSSDPETFRPSDYVGRFGWVTVQLDRVDPELMCDLIQDAWHRTAPKKLAADFDRQNAR